MEGTLEPGMDLVVTRWIGMRGTVRLAEIYEEKLKQRFSDPFIRKTGALSQQIQIHPDLELAKEAGAAAWYEVSEGGIYAALWRMAQASGVGLKIMLRRLPIRQETIEICEFFDINPYNLLSDGCLLLGCTNGGTLTERMEQAGIPAVWVGRATGGNDRILMNGEQIRYLERPQPDEIDKIIQ